MIIIYSSKVFQMNYFIALLFVKACKGLLETNTTKYFLNTRAGSRRRGGGDSQSESNMIILDDVIQI